MTSPGATSIVRASGRLRRRAVLLAIAVALAGCSGDDVRDASGEVVAAGEASVFDLRPGDCLDPPDGVTGEIADLPVVPCDEPHRQEVFALVAHDDEVYPGATEVATWADGACVNALEDGFERSLADGVYLSYLLPTFEGWNTEGDREAVCVLVFPTEGQVTGSVVAGTRTLPLAEPQPVQEPQPAADENESEGDAADGVGSVGVDTEGDDREGA